MADKRNRDESVERIERNNDVEKHEPPRTTKGGVTSPKFGSAGSGGAEFEQVPEQHREHRDKEDINDV